MVSDHDTDTRTLVPLSFASELTQATVIAPRDAAHPVISKPPPFLATNGADQTRVDPFIFGATGIVRSFRRALDCIDLHVTPSACAARSGSWKLELLSLRCTEPGHSGGELAYWDPSMHPY